MYTYLYAACMISLKTIAFSAGVARSNFCCINLKPRLFDISKIKLYRPSATHLSMHGKILNPYNA